MLAEIFKKPKPIIGKIQLLALPGSPGWDGQWDLLTARAEQEATALATGGVDALMVENFHDTPYTNGRMDTAGALALALLARRLKQFTNLPLGISVLRNDPETALAIAINTNADFIRLSVLSGALITESGVINSRLNELLHYKNRLKAELPPLLVDVSLRHLTTAPVSIDAGQHQTFAHLQKVSAALPTEGLQIYLVISDTEIKAEEVSMLKTALPWPVIIEHHRSHSMPDTWFEAADGLILDADIRKNSSIQPGLPPTIDMTRVEELVNRLRQVKSVS